MQLTIEKVKHALDRNILIACDGNKKFTFNAWQNEYTVWYKTERVDSGQALEELLIVYEELEA